MDFRTMKRRELQELCKKHGLKANATNLAMADSLAAFFEIQERKTRKGCLKVNRNSGSDVSKKVSFSLHEEGLENPVRSQQIITKKRARKEIEAEETDLGIRVVIVGLNDKEYAHSKLKKSERKMNTEEKLESAPRRRSKRVNQDHKSSDSVCQIEEALTRRSTCNSSKITAQEHEIMASNKDVDPARAKRSRKRLRDHVIDEKSLVAAEISHQQDAQPRRSARVASRKKPANLSVLELLPKQACKTKNSNGRRQVAELEDASKTIAEEPTDGNIGICNIVALDNDVLLEESSPHSSQAIVCNNSLAKLCEAKQDDQVQDMQAMNVSIQKTASICRKDQVHGEDKSTFTGSFDVETLVNDQNHEEQCHESPNFDSKDRGLGFDLGKKHLDAIEIASTGQGGSSSCLVNHLNDDYSSPVYHSNVDGLTCEKSDLYPSPRKVEYSRDQKVCSSTASGDELHAQIRGSLSASVLSEKHEEKFMAEESEQLTRHTSNVVFDEIPHCASVNNGSTVASEMADFEESFSKVDSSHANDMEFHMKSCPPSDNLNADFFESSSSIRNEEIRTRVSAASPEEVLLHQGSGHVEIYEPSIDKIAETIACDMVADSEDIVASTGVGNHLAQNIENVEKAIEKAEKLMCFLSWRSLSFHQITDNKVEELGVEPSPKEITYSLETSVSSSCGSRKSFNLLEVENFDESSKGAVLMHLDSRYYGKQPNSPADRHSSEDGNACEMEKLDCEAADYARKEDSLEPQNVQETSLFDTYEFNIAGSAENLSPVLGTVSLDVKGEEQLPEKVSLQHGKPVHRVVTPDPFISLSVPVERKVGDVLKTSHSWQSLREGAGIESFSVDLECTRETDELVFSYNNVEFPSHGCIGCKTAHSKTKEETTHSEALPESTEFEKCLGMADEVVCYVQNIKPSTAENISSAGRRDDILVGQSIQSVKQGSLEDELDTEGANFSASDTADEVRTGDGIPDKGTNILDECNYATAPRSLSWDATHPIINVEHHTCKEAPEMVQNEDYGLGEQRVEMKIIPKNDCAFLGKSPTGVAEVAREETPQNTECKFNCIEPAGFEEANNNCSKQVAVIEHGNNTGENAQSVGDILHEVELHGHARLTEKSEGIVMRERSEFGNKVKADDIQFMVTDNQEISEINTENPEAVGVEVPSFDTEAANVASINDFTEAFEIRDESKSGNAVNQLIRATTSEVPVGHTNNSMQILVDKILFMHAEEANITSEIVLTKDVSTETNGKPDIHAEGEPEKQMENPNTAYVDQNPLNSGEVIDEAAKSSFSESVTSIYEIEFVDLPSERISEAFNEGVEYSNAVYSDQGPCTSSQTINIASTIDEAQAVLSLDKSMHADTKHFEDSSIAAPDGCKEIPSEESFNEILSISSVVINKLSTADVSQVAATGDDSKVPSSTIEMANPVSENEVAQAITFEDDGKNSIQNVEPVIVADELSGCQAEEDARCTNDISLKSQPVDVGLEDTNGIISMDEMDELNRRLSKFQISSAMKIGRLRIRKTPNKPINKVTQINNTQGNDKENAKGKKTDSSCVRYMSKSMTPISARKPLQIVDNNNR